MAVGAIDGTLSFLDPTLSFTVATGQSVYVTVSAALGSTVGAANLVLAVGFATSGGGAINVANQVSGLTIGAGQRSNFTLSAVISGLAPGQYIFGMVAQTSDSNTNWDNNENGSATGLLLNS